MPEAFYQEIIMQDWPVLEITRCNASVDAGCVANDREAQAFFDKNQLQVNINSGVIDFEMLRKSDLAFKSQQ